MLTVGLTAHRPSRLSGGYKYTSLLNIQLYNRIKERFIELINKGYTRFIFGGALGGDQISFAAAYELSQVYNIELVLAIPYEGQADEWEEDYKQLYERQKLMAHKVVYVDTIDRYAVKDIPNGEYHIAKLGNRNKYIVDNSDIIEAIWDRVPKGGTYDCIKYANICNKIVELIKP